MHTNDQQRRGFRCNAVDNFSPEDSGTMIATDQEKRSGSASARIAITFSITSSWFGLLK